MPFCPECRYEYEPYIAVCPDCDTPLVDQLPEETPVEIEWVRLHPLPGTVYAEMVKEVLDRQNIPNLLIKNFLASAYSLNTTDLAGVESILLVPRPYKEEAERILHGMMDHI